jgi:hypothetical protein
MVSNVEPYSGTGLILVLKNHYFTFFFVTVNTKPTTGHVQICRGGKRYLEAVDKYQDIIARNMAENLYGRHIKSIFME